MIHGMVLADVEQGVFRGFEDSVYIASDVEVPGAEVYVGEPQRKGNSD